MHRATSSVLLFTFCLTIALAFSGAALAAPDFGTQYELRQPDGTTVSVRIWGDEYYQVVESLDGYTLVRDGSSGIICYARLSPNGANLVSTRVPVYSTDPSTLGVPKGIRVTKASRAFEIQKKREAALYGIGPNGGPSAAPPPSTGNVLGLVLIVDFDDQVATIDPDDVERFCNEPNYNDNGNNGSIRDYFLDVSDNLLDYTSWVMPEYHRASKLFSYYDDCDTNVAWLSRGKELIVEILDSLDTAGHDFSVYDSNSDGYIDGINLFYAGSRGCGWTRGMWPGSGSITDLWTSDDGVASGRYQITDMKASLTIGTYCHENGHMIGGWPDLYDYDGDSRGVGQWCLMASQFSKNPQEPCGYLKTTAGWATPTVINSDMFGISVGPSSNNANLFKFPSGAANEYYLVENRRQAGRETGLPDSGIMITHIDENGDHNANEMLPDKHFLVTVVQADGDWDLENDINSGDSGDLWHNAPPPSFSICTDPATNWWSGTASGFHFNNFSASLPTMTFDFSIGDSIPQALTKSYAEDPVGDCCITVEVSDIDNGSYDANGPGDIASLLITKKDGNPITPASSVEVCGDGFHTLTLTITDLCGNSTSSTATVEVVNDAPVAVCKPFEAEADSNCCIVVNLSDIDGGSYDPDGASDIKSLGITAIDGNPVTLTDKVDVCGKGWHTVTVTITDYCDSTSSCDADVEVLDVTPPEMTITLNRDMLWPPNHKYSEIVATIEVKDNCDPNPTFVLTSVSSSEPDNGRGDGNTTNDVADTSLGMPDTTISLRSERRGGGDGRKYTIRWTASDNCGNTRMDSACVWVPHDQSGVAQGSFGFTPLGQTVEDNAEEVALVFVTLPPTSVSWRDPSIWIGGWDATRMDPMQIYVGNTTGAIRPSWTTSAYDVNSDGLRDMMAYFPGDEVRAMVEATKATAGTGAVKKKGVAEAIGVHYIGPGGDTYLVSNIFTLGEPVFR